jgi:signal transduction histidine kinase
VSQDHLGLFDTPPDRKEIRFSIAMVGLMWAAVFLVLPIREVRVSEAPAFVPLIDALMFVGELITAALLYAQASVFRSRALISLATCYTFGAFLLIPHALTFPGAFAPDGLLGAGVSSTAWIYNFRRIAFPIAALLYVWLKDGDFAAQTPTERPATKVGVWVFAAVALATAVTLLTTVGHGMLPAYFYSRDDTIYSTALWFQSGLAALYVMTTIVLFRNRKSVLDMWLLVAFSGWLIQSFLILTLQSRFTAGWYCLFFLTLFSHLVVMLALIAESNRLYARLALSTAARNRERENRLMSMDAVAAAIAHEAGQPLAGVTLNASAGLNWLTRTPPSPEKAIKSLRATVDDARRTFDVIKSVRATFAKEPGTATEFSLNELARETATLMGRELAGHKVSLELALDEALPPIFGNRVQIQRVLINLLSNAIESLDAIGSRPRRIAIRSLPLDDKNVLLEVSDTGSGIGPEAMEHIFEAFFTTKSTGTGLGLSLCRTIVEEHGGGLRASPGERHGATFHLQLPRSGTPEETAIR